MVCLAGSDTFVVFDTLGLFFFLRRLMKILKILIVEDNDDDVFLAKRTLAKLNQNEVDVVCNGKEALQYLFGQIVVTPDTPIKVRPDIILLDQRMPYWDGLQFMEIAHHALKANNIPVIIITSSTLEHERDRFIELGIFDYIGKPINVEGLSRAINNVIGYDASVELSSPSMQKRKITPR
jgi:two-component system response regulator